MNRFGAGKDRAVLLGTIADRNDVIEFVIYESGYVLRGVLRDIDSDFVHDLDASRVHALGLSTGTVHFKPIARHLAKQSLRHLAASRIAGAQEQNAFFICHTQIPFLDASLRHPPQFSAKVATARTTTVLR